MRKSGEAKYFHLHDDLHVLIEVFAPPAEAYARMGHALEEIKKFLIPVSGFDALPVFQPLATLVSPGAGKAPSLLKSFTLATAGSPLLSP